MKTRSAETKDINTIVALWLEMMALHQSFNPIFKMRDNAVDLYFNYAKSVIEDNRKKAVVAEENERAPLRSVPTCSSSRGIDRTNSRRTNT